MVLVLAYPHLLDSSLLSSALQSGLDVFPHLAGRISGSLEPFDLKIKSSNAPVELELTESQRQLHITDLEALSISEHFSSFAPSSSSNIPHSSANFDQPLLQVRLTSLPVTGISVLGLFVSHMALDGTGLSLFLRRCMAGMEGVSTVEAVHDRQVLQLADIDPLPQLPHGYVVANRDTPVRTREWDFSSQCSLKVFTLDVQAVSSYLNVNSLRSARFGLTALLCSDLARANSNFTEIALWCDPRGTNGIPKSYTGNVGCYLHLPLISGHIGELTRELTSIATRDGFARIARTYRSLKSAEWQGQTVVWDGLAAGVLPVNLVTYAHSDAKIRNAVPGFAQMLTRNLHGLRISLTPDGRRFLVEVCLPTALPEALIESCRERGILKFVRGEN